MKVHRGDWPGVPQCSFCSWLLRKATLPSLPKDGSTCVTKFNGTWLKRMCTHLSQWTPSLGWSQSVGRLLLETLVESLLPCLFCFLHCLACDPFLAPLQCLQFSQILLNSSSSDLLSFLPCFPSFPSFSLAVLGFEFRALCFQSRMCSTAWAEKYDSFLGRAVLHFELRTSHLPGRCSATWDTLPDPWIFLPPFFIFFYHF
jgi:hypothetical protein